MSIKSFEELQVWQKAQTIVLEIYKTFNSSRNYAYKDQIERAALSIMNNIAEGFERQSNKEFIKFLYIAKGSCGECRSMLYVARELKYINRQQFDNLYDKLIEISRMLSGLIKKL